MINIPTLRDDIELDLIEHNGDHEKYLLRSNNRNYYVGKAIYIVINSLQEKKSLNEIATRLNSSTDGNDTNFSPANVRSIIEQNIRPLGIFTDSEENKVKNPIKATVKIIPGNVIKFLLSPFKFAFTPTFFFISLSIAVACNFYFFLFQNKFPSHIVILNNNLSFYLIYPTILLLTLIHEFGHATALLRNKLVTKYIGFGFYYFLPVMYTEATSAWRLNKLQRIILNLSGIYVQLLINTFLFFLLILLYLQGKQTAFISYTISVNLAIIVLNLIPFIKYDAYWLVSDIFSLTNLQAQRKTFNTHLFSFLIKRDKSLLNYSISKDLPLILYSILSLIFFVFIYYNVLKATYHELLELDIILLLIQNFNYSFLSILVILKFVLFVLFSLIIVWSLVSKIIKFFFYK